LCYGEESLSDWPLTTRGGPPRPRLASDRNGAAPAPRSTADRPPWAPRSRSQVLQRPRHVLAPRGARADGHADTELAAQARVRDEEAPRGIHTLHRFHRGALRGRFVAGNDLAEDHHAEHLRRDELDVVAHLQLLCEALRIRDVVAD